MIGRKRENLKSESCQDFDLCFQLKFLLIYWYFVAASDYNLGLLSKASDIFKP